MNEILVLGAGAWGTSVANLIADNTKRVFIYGHLKKR